MDAPTPEEVEALRLRIEAWVADDPEPSKVRDVTELRYVISDGGEAGEAAEDELIELFRGQVEFGTAGLRAPLGAGPARMNRAVVRRAAAGVGTWVRAGGSGGPQGPDGGVVVGRDARHGSEEFVTDTVEVLLGAGLTVHLLPAPLPTPVVAFAVRHLRASAGVMVTASHNPGTDNGYKVFDGGGRQVDAHQAASIAAAMAVAGPVADLPIGSGDSPLLHRYDLDIVDRYIAAVSEAVLRPKSGRAKVEVAHTALHGVGARVVRQACRQTGFINLHEVSEQAEPDPDFPTVRFPNPEEPGALNRLGALAAWSNADVALAHDPDADRLAMAVHDPALGDRRNPASWRPLGGDELGWLLADHLIRRGGYPPRGVLVSTVVSSSLLRALAAEAGLGYAETLTGFKWIVRATTRERPLIFGYEEALGYCVGDVVRDKDGISALLLAAEMVSDLLEQGQSILDRLDDLARRFGVHATGQWSVRLGGRDGEERIAEAMGRLRVSPPTAVAGREVVAVSDLAHGAPDRRLPPADLVGLALRGARVLVRPSGTEPKLKVYLEVVEPVGGDDGDLAAARGEAKAGLDALMAALPATLGLD